MNKMKKLLVGAAAGALMLAATAGPAFAVVHPFVPADECSENKGGGGQAIAHGGIDLPGAENDKLNNPAGVGAPVPLNNPGNGSPTGASVPDACTEIIT